MKITKELVKKSTKKLKHQLLIFIMQKKIKKILKNTWQSIRLYSKIKYVTKLTKKYIEK